MLALHLGQPEVFWYQLDFESAYLTASVKRDIYIRLPEGFRKPGREHEVYKLRKALYGGVDSGRCFYDEYLQYHKEMGFQPIHHDRCFLQIHWLEKKQFIKIAFHVDDCLMAVKGQEIMEWYLHALRVRYKFKFGKLEHFLGVRFTFSEDGNSVHLDQEQQVFKLLDQIGMSDCKSAPTPIKDTAVPNSTHSPQTEEEKKKVRDYPYQEVVGHLSYLESATRPDITYAVKVASKFGTTYGEAHIQWVKRIVRYLKGTAKHGIILTKSEPQPKLRIFSDANHVKDVDTRRSLSGMTTKLSSSTVDWKCKYQRIPSHSTCESELMAMDFAICRGEYIRYLAQSIGAPVQGTIPLYVDNQAAINLASNPIQAR